MADKVKLTITRAQREALLLSREGDIIRWPGGFWALKDEPVNGSQGEYPIPSRYISAGTIYALDRKRCLFETEVGETHPWSGPRRITPLGLSLLNGDKNDQAQ